MLVVSRVHPHTYMYTSEGELLLLEISHLGGSSSKFANYLCHIPSFLSFLLSHPRSTPIHPKMVAAALGPFARLLRVGKAEKRLLKDENRWLKDRVRSLEARCESLETTCESLEAACESWEATSAFQEYFVLQASLIASTATQRSNRAVSEDAGAVEDSKRPVPPKLPNRPTPKPFGEPRVQSGLLDLVRPPAETEKGACSLVYTRHHLNALNSGVVVVDKCSFCGRMGHKKEQCFFNPDSDNCRAELVQGKCRFCCRKGHEETNCFFNPDGSNYRPDSAKKRRPTRRGKASRGAK